MPKFHVCTGLLHLLYYTDHDCLILNYVCNKMIMIIMIIVWRCNDTVVFKWSIEPEAVLKRLYRDYPSCSFHLMLVDRKLGKHDIKGSVCPLISGTRGLGVKGPDCGRQVLMKIKGMIFLSSFLAFVNRNSVPVTISWQAEAYPCH